MIDRTGTSCSPGALACRSAVAARLQQFARWPIPVLPAISSGLLACAVAVLPYRATTLAFAKKTVVSAALTAVCAGRGGWGGRLAVGWSFALVGGGCCCAATQPSMGWVGGRPTDEQLAGAAVRAARVRRHARWRCSAEEVRPGWPEMLAEVTCRHGGRVAVPGRMGTRRWFGSPPGAGM